MGILFFEKYGYVLRKAWNLIIVTSVGCMILNKEVVAAQVDQTEEAAQISSWFSEPYSAPEITGITNWFNSSPLELNQLKGKIVLLFFWTYSSSNCIHILPFINDFYQKYHDKGLEIIGIHSPEFGFEHKIANVKIALEKFNIKYPVALDNNFITWKNYNNQYWPSIFLIDQKGDIVYNHFGEEEYFVLESNIRDLLGLPEESNSKVAEVNNSLSEKTSEIHLGLKRTRLFANVESVTLNKTYNYKFPSSLKDNYWALNGRWAISSEKIISSRADASFKINFNAKKVFVVMGSVSNLQVKIRLLLNGEPLINEKGKDVADSIVTVKDHRLYEIIDTQKNVQGVLQLIALTPGLELYTLSFDL